MKAQDKGCAPFTPAQCEERIERLYQALYAMERWTQAISRASDADALASLRRVQTGQSSNYLQAFHALKTEAAHRTATVLGLADVAFPRNGERHA